jgi:predicted alpha/beta superfamily hydrolase
VSTSIALPRSRELLAGGAGPRLVVAWPEAPPPPAGWPLLLLLDGAACFATAVETARFQARRPEVTGVTPLVVAAVSHADAAPGLRERDFTQPGAAAFLDWVERVALPQVAAACPCDPARRTIFGHSLGGLFVLHALFARASLFARHVAASPSIWRDVDPVREGADRLLAAPPHGRQPRLLMLVGEFEIDDPRMEATRRARLRERRMGAHAEELAARLAQPGGASVRVAQMAGENHASIVPAAISRAIRFALEDE